VKILHVIERLGRGGAARSMLALCRYSGGEHSVLSLLSPDPVGLELARAAGVEVLTESEGESVRARLAAADVEGQPAERVTPASPTW
jgi:hypothetical protein